MKAPKHRNYSRTAVITKKIIKEILKLRAQILIGGLVNHSGRLRKDVMFVNALVAGLEIILYQSKNWQRKSSKNR